MLALVGAQPDWAEPAVARLRRSLASVRTGPARFDLGAGLGDASRQSAGRPDLSTHALYWVSSLDRNEWCLYSSTVDGLLTPASSAEEIERRNLVQALLATGRSIDARNRFTGGHVERVATYAVALAKSLGFEQHRIEMMQLAARLHDVGKVGVSDVVLLKESPPNLEDETEVRRHSDLGRAMLAGAGLPDVARWVHHLHERFDGRGYPDALAGRQIPVESRILHAADALDNMTRPHVYRRHRPLREALAELAFGAGTRLDPELSQRLIQLVQGGQLAIPGHEAVGRGQRRPATRRVRGGVVR
jgi:HD-GYP domain-containing protein (c-di-GMP phosphodiesterase class II)